jgi:hypothetical protein
MKTEVQSNEELLQVLLNTATRIARTSPATEITHRLSWCQDVLRRMRKPGAASKVPQPEWLPNGTLICYRFPGSGLRDKWWGFVSGHMPATKRCEARYWIRSGSRGEYVECSMVLPASADTIIRQQRLAWDCSASTIRAKLAEAARYLRGAARNRALEAIAPKKRKVV